MVDVFAIESARVADRRQPVVKGESFDEGDPVVRAHPHLFATAEEAASSAKRPTSTTELGERAMSTRKMRARGVEQATAAPGEVRNVDLSCKEDGCDFVARSPAGLARHQSVHQDDEDSEE